MSTYETTAGLGDERVRILPRRGLVKNHYYARATHRIVEVMWSNRGAFVEKLSLAKPSPTIRNLIRLRCKGTAFFLTWQWVVPDVVRSVSRISCNHSLVTSVTPVTPRVFFF